MLPFGKRLHPVVSFLFGTLQLASVAHADSTPNWGTASGPPTGPSVGGFIGSPTEDHPRSGLAIPGNYSGSFRPQVHFSAPQHFLNDPNGMFRDDNGTWHLYYQYNPTALEAGHQHWGHATSRDLYHWINQPMAIYPPAEFQPVFTGSCVIDKNNTSGFFPNQTNGVVALYTIGDYSTPPPYKQQQALSYSRDGGYTFTAYEHNPVIPSNSTQFRDPKILWYEDHWVMLVVYAADFVVSIWTSPNLIEWTHASNFTGEGIYNLQWECPNLVRLPQYDSQGQLVDRVWLLMIGINPRAPLGGSGTVYFTGSFNGTHFEAMQHIPRLADMGKDNYAGQFFYGQPDDEEPVYIGWASNWQYTNEVPTDRENWRGMLTIPRRTFIHKLQDVDWNMNQVPYDMSPIMGETLYCGELPVNKSISIDFSHVESSALYWEMKVIGHPGLGSPKNMTHDFNFTNPETGEYVRGGHLFGAYEDVYLDRGGAKAFDYVFMSDKVTTNSFPINGTWSMSGVLDRSIIEVFINNGEDSGTMSYYTTKPFTVMNIGTSNLVPSMNGTLCVSALNSAWDKMKSPDGLVWGNQTKVNIIPGKD
ncbi:hypothetical protein E4U54_003124 [Claviceps lovelessii]|nr:hypothetical protein E4U54_003124 [Claviceps lovelessii]